jgi:pilus assembly protein CpaC
MLGGLSRIATCVAIASTVLLGSCTTRSAYKGFAGSNEKFDTLAHPYPGQTGALNQGIQKEIVPPERPMAKTADTLKPAEPIWIPSGKSRVIHLDTPVRRVSIGDPDLAGIVVLGPKTLMINAKEAPKREGGAGGGGGHGVGVVTGKTLTPEPRFAETTVAIWHSGSEAPDIHTLVVADFIDRQVMLEVTVAELKRTAMEEFGIDFRNAANSFVSAYFMGGGAGATPGGASSLIPVQGSGLLPVGTAANATTYAFNLPKEDITAFIQILQDEGLATILAQPKLLAMSGQNAVFQVGGEIPIPVATGFAVDVIFKPFGTIVTFIPRVSEEGDIMLTVTPEVSEADFTSPVLGLPSFRTRRASTTSRLRNGETLVIGGLLQSQRSEDVQGIPYLQDIPAIGIIFRHTRYIDQLTELVVVVTPHLAEPMAPGTEIALPTDRWPLTNDEVRTKANPFEATRPRVPGTP